MYAVIETGGKQYCVSEGSRLKVEKLTVEAGGEVVLDRVLMLGGSSFNVGAPYVSGAKVTAEVIEHARAKKIVIFKKRRRQDSRLKQGHRQTYTTIRIKSITA